MTINHATHDLFERFVDGWYWLLLEKTFEDCERQYRASGDELAAATAHRLAETTDNIPAEIIREFQDLWNVVVDHPDGQSAADLAINEMMAAFGVGYSPNTATAFALDFINRLTGARTQ